MINKDIGNMTIMDVDFWGQWADNQGGMTVDWSLPGTGFGQITIMKNQEGHLVAKTENMCKEEDKKFLKEVLETLIKELDVVE